MFGGEYFGNEYYGQYVSVIQLSQGVSESVTLSEAVTKVVVKNLTDSVTLSDSVSYSFPFVISESVSVSDSVSFVKEMVYQTLEEVSLSESIQISLNTQSVRWYTKTGNDWYTREIV